MPEAEAVQSAQDASPVNQVTNNHAAKEDADANTKPVAESQQPPASIESTDPDGDDDSSSGTDESDDDGAPESYRPRGKPSKPLASQAKPVKR